MTKYDCIVLSPHLDDAVACFGGTISKKISEGKKVHVVNCYTKGIDHSILPEKFWKFDIYDQRKEEDREALEYLGASFEHLDLQERVMREPWLKNVLGVFRSPNKIESFQEISNIQLKLAQLLKENPEAEFYCPLGSGNHFDHIETFLASYLFMLDNALLTQFSFYEDLYSVGTRMRKRHFVTKTNSWNFFSAPANSVPRMNIMLMVMGASAKGPMVRDYISDYIDDLVFIPEIEPIDDIHFNRKLDALFMYPSQAQAFGNKRSRAEKVLRRYHRFWDNGEVSWYFCIIPE